MLILNLSIIAGVYVGKQAFDSYRRRRKTASVQAAPDAQAISADTPKSKTLVSADTSLGHAKVSGVSVLIVTAGYFIYPPLTLISIGVISYNLAPILQRGFKAMQTDKKVNNDSYSALITVLMVGTNGYFAAAMHNWVYHLSSHLVEKSQTDSVRFAADAYQLVPEKVWVRTGCLEQQIPLEQVKAGDGIIVNTGAAIPVDGVVIEGSALIDQQALTGETHAMEKMVGDNVMAATMS